MHCSTLHHRCVRESAHTNTHLDTHVTGDEEIFLRSILRFTSYERARAVKGEENERKSGNKNYCETLCVQDVD
jgi:hypothetical protein